MNKILVFDMDGTIADLYGVDNWLEDLRNESTRPYDVAEPLYDMEILNEILLFLKLQGWRIVVTTWLSKESNPTYDNLVRESKLAWLEKYHFPYDEIHLIKYGTTKANCTRHLGGLQILIDDNEQLRKGWHLGGTVDANKSIITALLSLISSGNI